MPLLVLWPRTLAPASLPLPGCGCAPRGLGVRPSIFRRVLVTASIVCGQLGAVGFAHSCPNSHHRNLRLPPGLPWAPPAAPSRPGAHAASCCHALPGAAVQEVLPTKHLQRRERVHRAPDARGGRKSLHRGQCPGPATVPRAGSHAGGWRCRRLWRLPAWHLLQSGTGAVNDGNPDCVTTCLSMGDICWAPTKLNTRLLDLWPTHGRTPSPGGPASGGCCAQVTGDQLTQDCHSGQYTGPVRPSAWATSGSGDAQNCTLTEVLGTPSRPPSCPCPVLFLQAWLHHRAPESPNLPERPSAQL